MNGFVATMQVIDAVLRRYELQRAVVPVLVVDSWSPVVGLVIRDYIGRAITLAKRIVSVCSIKFVAAHHSVNMLAIASKPSGVT